MLNDKKFDFSEESKIKESLFVRMKHKYEYEKKHPNDASELSDSELRLVAGGKSEKCQGGANCSSCINNKNGKCIFS
ncbi:MAG TPA: hypothetical protein PKK26_06310 [Candidatus Wallbacteria bacterium]|nr:hypothetical protein [Candidatus Wallbacteria bacterium]